jgi:hypothetical protein
MESEKTVFLYPDPEIQALLADNETDLVDLLRREGLNVRSGPETEPGLPIGLRHKEPASVIVASAALIAALTPALVRLIEALAHRSVVVEEKVLQPVENSKGEVVRDKLGEPVLQWVNRAKVIQSTLPHSDAPTVDIKGPIGISISYRSNMRS